MKSDPMGGRESRPLSVKDLDNSGKLSGEIALPKYQATTNSRSKDGAPPPPPPSEKEISGAPTGADAIRSFLVLFLGAIAFAGIAYAVKMREDEINAEQAAAEMQQQEIDGSYSNDAAGRHQRQIDLLNRRTNN